MRPYGRPALIASLALVIITIFAVGNAPAAPDMSSTALTAGDGALVVQVLGDATPTPVPVSGARVQYYFRYEGSSIIGSRVADASGTVVFDGLGDGVAILTPQDPGLLFLSTETTTVVSAGTTTTVDILMPLGGRIEGTVTTGTPSAPAEYVEVVAGRADGFSVKVESEADGAYVCGPLAPGVYRMYFECDPPLSAGPEFYDDVNSFDHTLATTLTIAAGETLSNVDAHLDPGATISGTFRRMGSSELLGCRAEVYASYPVLRFGWDPQWHEVHWTYANGEPYRLGGLSAGGPYMVHARGSHFWPAWAPGTPDPALATTFSLPAAGEVTGADIELVQSDLRVGGDDRYGTAVATSRNVFCAALTDAVVVASGEDFADGLTGSTLAGAVRGPLLLTPHDTLPAEVATEIERLGVKDVYVLGGSAAVADGVLERLDRIPGVAHVERIAGRDRYETAARVARRTAQIAGSRFSTDAFLVRGDDFADGVAVSPYAFSGVRPVLLTRPDRLPATTADALEDLGSDRVFIAGLEGAVSESVADEVSELADGSMRVHRYGGPDRYKTAYSLARAAIARGWSGDADIELPGDDWTHVERLVGLCTGSAFPDALVAGPAVGIRNGVLLFPQPYETEYPVVLRFASEYAFIFSLEQSTISGISGTIVFGQEGVVSTDIWDAFLDRIRGIPPIE